MTTSGTTHSSGLLLVLLCQNPDEHECKAMEAMQIALEANVQLANMLRSMKQQYGSVSSDNNNDVYGP
jgi:hypothetical protein